MPSPPTPFSTLSEPTQTPIPAISSASTTKLRPLPAMPQATLHSQPAISPSPSSQSCFASLRATSREPTYRSLQISPGAQFRADQNPARPQDRSNGHHSENDPIWPDYALPNENVPSSTTEGLQTRLSRLAQVQFRANTDLLYAAQPRDWSREIQMVQGDSAVWMTLIRSRWLVIETLSGHLQLWDIEGAGDFDGVLGSFSTLEGSVDGAVVTEEAGGAAGLFISTTKYCTYSFILDVPHYGQDHKDAYALAPYNTTIGFSALKDKKGQWWAFAKSEGTTNQGFVYVPHANAALIRLAAASHLAENQNVLDMFIRDDIVVVARNQTIDLYSTSDVFKLLGTQHPDTFLPFIQFEESISIPKHNFLHHTRVLRRAPAYVRAPNSGIYCASFTSSGWVVSSIEQNSTRGSSHYFLSAVNGVATGLRGPLTIVWGESGSRMIAVGSYNLNMYFADPRQTPASEGGTTNRGHLLAQWKIPRDTKDIPRCAAFDEATGIAVVGMHSGRLLVADAGTWVPLSPGPDDDSDDYKFEWDSRSIHPSPKRWPRIGSNPAMFMPKDLLKSEYPAPLAPGCFMELEKWYPFANHPDYYGSIPWIVREVTGIPSESQCTIFSSMDIDHEHGSNSALIELDVEVGNGGKLLLLLWSGEESLDFQLYQLRSGITKEAVIQKVQCGEPLGPFCESQPWSRNPLSIGQLAAWVGQPREGETGLITFDRASLPNV